MSELSPYLGAFREWLLAGGIAVLIVGVVRLAKPVLISRLEALSRRTSTRVDDAVLEVIKATRIWLVAVIALVVGSQILQPSDAIEKLLKASSTIAVFAQIGLWITACWGFWVGKSREKALQSNIGAATSLSAMAFVGELLIWTTIGLVTLDNLGINITTLIAGLGVGGVAVALAVQNVLGDLFASLSIVIDKPFVIGDFIIVDAYMGTVENVGLKTTRIRSLDGEQIVFANSDLLKNRIRNYKRMLERRVVFGFGVIYQTRSKELESIPPLLRQIVEAQKSVRFDRAHCSKFGDSSIDFEVVYWLLNPDYNFFMDTQQNIIFSIKRALEEAGVEFAYPTRSVFIDGSVRLEDQEDDAPSKQGSKRARRLHLASGRH